MSENSTKQEIGRISYTRDYKVFTWKIPNISSIPHLVDHVVQSPPFSFENASWILIMYPYGQTEYRSEGYIDVIIERLSSQTPGHRVQCRMYCKNVFNKEDNGKAANFCFDSALPQAKITHFMQNLKESPEKWNYAPDDTFTLVFEFSLILTDNNFGKELRRTVVEKKGMNGLKRNPEVGKIFKGEEAKSLTWKLWNIPESPLPAGYQALSPQFYFANATWILKMWPYYRLKHFRKPSFDILLQRLHSVVPLHYVTFIISIFYPSRKLVEGFSFFSTYHTQGDVINFELPELIDPQWMNLRFEIDIKTKKIGEIELEPQIKLLEPAILVDDKMPELPAIFPKNKLLQDIKELFLKQESCDVTIKVKGQEFPAHSLILKARSPVFASTFRIDMKEKATGIIDIEDYEPSHFSDFLSFLYSGEVENLSAENVFSLFTAADRYDVPDLKTLCMQFMKQNLTVDTFCDTIAVA